MAYVWIVTVERDGITELISTHESMLEAETASKAVLEQGCSGVQIISLQVEE